VGLAATVTDVVFLTLDAPTQRRVDYTCQTSPFDPRPIGSENTETLLLSNEPDENEEVYEQREEDHEEDQREEEDEAELKREGADESAEEERDEERLEQDEEEHKQEGTRLKRRPSIKTKKPKRKARVKAK
jgi:cobalamin biosynthesis protein CobT